MEPVVIKPVLQTVLINVLLLMDHASVLKDITVNVVKGCARALVKHVTTVTSALYVQLVNTDHPVSFHATVTEDHAIS